MKVKNFIIFGLVMSLLTACGAGCRKSGSKTGGASDTVVDVKIYNAGYGIKWLESAAENFEYVYKDKGYKINIVEKTNDVSDKAKNELPDVAKNNIDLYFIDGVDVSEYIQSTPSKMLAKNQTLLEDLSDVYSSKAINFKGKEEGVSIESKLQSSNARFYKFNGNGNDEYERFEGNYYSFPWASGAAGLYMNRSVLDRYDLEVPRTTDELLAQYDVICPNGKPVNSGVYPITYAGGNAMGYWMYMYDTLFAQYSGVEAENAFWNLKPTSDGYSVYSDEGILKALETIENVIDDKYVMNGTNNLSSTNSQLNLLQGKALYACTGNWVYNEMSLNYSQYVDNMEMIKMPIISALGTKLGFASDAVLSSVVKGIDDGKTDNVIASENSVDAEKVAKVREARNVYFNASVNHVAVVPSYSPSKDVAKIFLRFLASDDNLDLYKQKTNSSLPFSYEGSSKYNANNFVKSVDNVSGSADAVMVAEDLYTSIIRQCGVMCFIDVPYATVFNEIAKKENSAQYYYEYGIKQSRANWSTYLRLAGVR